MNEVFNQVMPVVTVSAITSRKEGRRVYPNEVLLARGTGDLAQDSLVLAHQIRTISKQRLGTQRGAIDDPSVQEKIQQALRIHLDL